MFNSFHVNIAKPRKVSDIIHDNNHRDSYDQSLNDNNFNVSTSQKFTVPIKEYSNKYLVLHQKDFQEKNIQRSLKKTLIQNKRKPFRKYKKFNKENGLSKVCKTEPNCQEDLYQDHEIAQPQQYQRQAQKSSKSTYSRRQQNNFFHINASVFSHFSSLSKKQLQMYDKLCQRQKSNNTPAINKYKKITQILQENHCYSQVQNINSAHKKNEKISTSRALEKYSKIIKINCQDASSVLSKMKIKKQFAHLNNKNKQKSDIYTKKIVLQKKQEPHPIYKIKTLKSNKDQSSIQKSLSKNTNETESNSFTQTKRIRNRQRVKTQFQLQDYKQNMKSNMKKYLQIDNQNFQLNGWEVNI